MSEVIGRCLKTLLNIDKNVSKYVHKYKNYHDHFIVDNRDPIIEHIKYANGCNVKPKSVKSYDFTSLYTNIPHNKLKANMSKFVNKIFKINSDKRYITISKKTAFLSKYKSKTMLSFTRADLIKHINFIIDNSYIVFNGQIYRQIIGIPMGTGCAPHTANIFLHVYEYEFISKLVSDDDNNNN